MLGIASSTMKLSQLRKRAVEEGADEVAMEEAADGSDEKGALVELILSCQSSVVDAHGGHGSQAM